MTQSLRNLVLAGLTSLIASCGSDDTEDQEDTGSEACRAVCAKQADASGCADLSEYEQQCKEACVENIPLFDASCRAKAEVMYLCLVELDYECPDGGDYPITISGSCEAQEEAFEAACQPPIED